MLGNEMNQLERYLKQATRGLPRQEKQRVTEELRGSLLERATEWQLTGKSETEALHLALQEFGDPAPLAAGMRRVHTLPKVVFPVTVLGTVGVLLLTFPRPAAGIPSFPDPSVQSCPLDTASSNPLDKVQHWWSCRRTSKVFRHLLRPEDIVQAFTRQGITTRLDDRGILHLERPSTGLSEKIHLSESMQKIEGQRFVDLTRLVTTMIWDIQSPVRLEGEVNPTIVFKGVRLQLGRADAPVYAADLLSQRVAVVLAPDMQQALMAAGMPLPTDESGVAATAGVFSDSPENAGVQIAGGAGKLFAMVDNQGCLQRECSSWLLRVRTAGHQGELPLPTFQSIPIVETPEALGAATKRGQPAVLIWEIDTADLKALQAHLIAPARVKSL